MQFPAEIASTSVTKKTCKITLLIDDQHREAVMQNLHNFIDRPINVNITIDADKRLAQLNTISDDRRKISNEGKTMIALCRKHHSELHNMSEQEFMQKYHVCGVKM